MKKNQAIRELMDKAAAKGTGLIGLGFCDLESGEEYYINGDRLFPLASVYKIMTFCELMRWLKEGRIHLTDRIVLHEADKKGGSGILKEAPDGSEYSMKEYIDLMMQISDNTASDYLVRLVGKEAIYRDVIGPLHLDHTSIDLACEGLLAKYYANPNGYYTDPKTGRRVGNFRNSPYYTCEAERNIQSTPRDMLELLKALYQGRVVDPENDAAILNEMAQCQTNTRLPARLPEGTRVAHKTGTLDHLACDVGIVYTPAGNYILSCFYNGNLATEEEYTGSSYSEIGTGILADLSYEVYQAYNA